MRGKPWKDQLAVGRVFELRSASTKYPPPCALIIRIGSYEREVVEVDRSGCIGDHLYARHSNPNVYLYSLEKIRKKIARRRRDLERFDCFDLDLIRYGYALDFDGRIHGSSEVRIPHTLPCTWTVFWVPAFVDNDWIKLWTLDDEWKRLNHGAWHFDNRGGQRDLGYKYGRVWATRHTGQRLRQIREFLRAKRPDVIEQQVRVIQWRDAEREYTSELRVESPALGTLSLNWRSLKTGDHGFHVEGVHL